MGFTPASGEKRDRGKGEEEYIETATNAEVHSGEPESEPHGQVYTEISVDEEHFEWREVLRGVFDVQTWLTALAYMAILISLYSYSLFL